MGDFVLNIDGNDIDLEGNDAIIDELDLKYGEGIDTLTFHRYGMSLATPPDPWANKVVLLTHLGNLVFSGMVATVDVHREQEGYRYVYLAQGLRGLADYVPLTDDLGTYGYDTAEFNLPADDPGYIASRAGRTVGQILSTLLTQKTNANALNGYGIGNYTGLPTTPVLPSSTVADLATLLVIPQAMVVLSGEKLFGCLEDLVRTHQPNHRLWIEPGGDIRVLNLDQYAAHTFEMGTDPIDPVEWNRETSECFSRVVVRGAPWVVPFNLKLSQGGITENFAYGSKTNAQAKSTWSCSTDWKTTGSFGDTGTCTCPTTTTITVTSSTSSKTWASGYWDQTGSNAHGVINLWYTAGSGLTQGWTARIVSNTSLSAGGTSTLTIDAALPVTNFNRYTISGLASGGNLVYRKYQVADSTVRNSLAKEFPYPVPFTFAGGAAATLTSFPMAVVNYSTSGNAPYLQFPLNFSIDYSTGDIIFDKPTCLVFGTCDTPAYANDIQVLLAVNVGSLSVASPQNILGVPQYGGTFYTVDGVERTLTITVSDMKDPQNLSQLQTYADELAKTVRDAVIEGQVVYHGLFADAMTPGMGLNIAWDCGVTGWEDTAGLSSDPTYPGVPVRTVRILWNQEDATPFTTVFTVSNRKDQIAASDFLHPARTGLTWGSSEYETGFSATNASGGPNMDPGDLAMLRSMGSGGPNIADPFGGLMGQGNPMDRFAGNPMSQIGNPMESMMGNPMEGLMQSTMGTQGDIPTSPGDYLRSIGAPTNPGDFLRSMNGSGPAEFMGAGGDDAGDGGDGEQEDLGMGNEEADKDDQPEGGMEE